MGSAMTILSPRAVRKLPMSFIEGDFRIINSLLLNASPSSHGLKLSSSWLETISPSSFFVYLFIYFFPFGCREREGNSKEKAHFGRRKEMDYPFVSCLVCEKVDEK